MRTMLEYYITGSEEEFRRLEVYHYFGVLERILALTICHMCDMLDVPSISYHTNS